MRLRPMLSYLTLLWVAAGCQDSNDPDPPDATDAGLDATVRPMDAAADTGAADTGLDATADATADATLDAGCSVDFPSCAFARAVEVECEGAQCSGATPVCYRRYVVDPTAFCGAADASVIPADASITQAMNYTHDECDDSNDCPEGTRCFDSYFKPLARNDGARCLPEEQTYCASPMSFPAYRWQRCKQDCECPRDWRCSSGRCAP